MEQDNTCDDTEYCEFQYLYTEQEKQTEKSEGPKGNVENPPGRYSSAPAFLLTTRQNRF